METTFKKLTVAATVNAPIEKAWLYWTEPEHIVQWSFASDDWHTPLSKYDLRTCGLFSSRMEAIDGCMGFDFEGVYDEVETNELIRYSLADGRTVSVHFEDLGGTTRITETFDAETQNPLEMQQGGWQAILNNFKKYVESN